MQDVHIKQAQPDDLNLLLEWRMLVLEAVFEHYPKGMQLQLREANRKYYLQHLSSGTNISCFAWKDNAPVGCGAMCILQEMPSPDNPGGLVGYLMNVFVQPEFRGLGIGSRIVEWLLAQGTKLNITKFMLETTEMGREVYIRSGFRDAQGYMLLTRGDLDENSAGT